MDFKQVIGSRIKLTRNPRRSKLDQAGFVNLWRESQMTRAAFCRAHDLKIKTFSRWLRESKQPLDVGVTRSLQPEALLTQYELELPNKAILRITGSIEAQDMLTLIKEISACSFN